MDHKTLAFLLMMVLVAAVAPVIANQRKASPDAGSCGILAKFDKKTKNCHAKP